MSLPPNAPQALNLLRSPQTRIYLGARYGLTPHTWISPAKASEFLTRPVDKSRDEPFCSLATTLELEFGTEAVGEAFAEHYSRLERVVPAVKSELELLRPHAAGKVFVTGSYSSDIVNNFPNLVTATDDTGRSNIRFDVATKNASLVMLHGWRSDSASALLTRQQIDSFDTLRPELTSLLRNLLQQKPWLILGYSDGEDATFMRHCLDICRALKSPQRPIFVVDPAATETLYGQWPRDALRHVQMEVLDFLHAANDSRGDTATRDPGTPPRPPSGGPDFQRTDEGPASTPPPGFQNQEGGKDEGPSPPHPGPARERSFYIETLDGSVFRTRAPGDLRVSVLASRFIQQHSGGTGTGSGRRAVVDFLDENGTPVRCNGTDSLEEAGIDDESRVRIYSDTIAGSVDPRRREAYLNDVQLQLEELARQDDRVQVKPNLIQASDRYELTLSCGGWLPPEATGIGPSRSFEQKLRLEYPAEAPSVAPTVWWLSKLYHPNVHPKTGYVCLGALQESWTPLFGPQELVRMLIELSEYRNYELKGVLNRDAAIWAQLNPDLLVEQGGWAYQPTLEDTTDEKAPLLVFEDLGTGVGLRRRRKP